MPSKCYICRECGKKFMMFGGIGTPGLIRHIEEKHDDMKKQYWELPISEMIKCCFDEKTEV